MSSCGNSNCSCGANCSCGSGCNCNTCPDLTSGEKFTTAGTMILGVAPEKRSFEGFESAAGSENDCKCGSNCNCGSCSCK